MTLRRFFPALCVPVALAAAFAQTVTPKPAPAETKPAAEAAKPETPEDQKAYSAATKVTDPTKKIEALEKFKADFPKSDMLSAADSAILSTLLKKFPEQKGRIAKQAKAMYSRATKNKGSVANQIAGEFLDAGLLLNEAEGYAKKGVADMQQAKYTADLKTTYEKRKAKPPSDEEIAKRYRESRASRLATLGGSK